MADMVEKKMEEMVPELVDLERKKIFTKKEIKRIVEKRRDFEYCLHSNSVSKREFLSAVKFEIALEVTRRDRCRKLKWRKKTVSDYAIIRRVMSLFTRATDKWKHDLPLWYQYVDFCLQAGSTKSMQSVILRALRWHPKDAALWVLAADRELKLGNVEFARTLIKRGLRVAPAEQRLYTEYMRLESIIVYKMAIAQMAVKGDEALLGESKVSAIVPLVVFKNGVQKLQGEGLVTFLLAGAAAHHRLAAQSEAQIIDGLGNWDKLIYQSVAEHEQLDPQLTVLLWSNALRSAAQREQVVERLVEECFLPEYKFRVAALAGYIKDSLAKETTSEVPLELLTSEEVLSVLTRVAAQGAHVGVRAPELVEVMEQLPSFPRSLIPEFAAAALAAARDAGEPLAPLLWCYWRAANHQVTIEDVETMARAGAPAQYFLSLCTLVTPSPDLFVKCALAVTDSKADFVIPAMASRGDAKEVIAVINDLSLPKGDAALLKCAVYRAAMLTEPRVEWCEAAVKLTALCDEQTEVDMWLMYAGFMEQQVKMGISADPSAVHWRAQQAVRDKLAYTEGHQKLIRA